MSTENVISSEVVGISHTELARSDATIIDLIEYRETKEEPVEDFVDADESNMSELLHPVPQSVPSSIDLISFPLDLSLSGIDDRTTTLTPPAPLTPHLATVTSMSGRTVAGRAHRRERSLGKRAA